MSGPQARFVVATAGHVDHGKSTLVRALTGIEPDRWAEERRRGLTIDLGFAWTTMPSGADVAFVDVPGHERFLGNMLAGLGPAPVVCFIVAADEGWSAQSSDHRDALAALGIDHGLIVVTKIDRVDDGGAATMVAARNELRHTGLAEAPAVAVSARTGEGLDALTVALDRVLATVPAPDTTGRVRLWVDRSFTIGGAGTIVTGTLTEGTLAVGDTVELFHANTLRTLMIRGLQTEGADRDTVGPTSRVAVNLRGIAATGVERGDVLLTPRAWRPTSNVDVGRVSGDFADMPHHLTAHIGSASIPVRVRPLDDERLRLALAAPAMLIRGDRIVLRDPGTRRIIGGVRVLDADPPPLRRRGDAKRRAAELGEQSGAPDLVREVERRGYVAADRLRELGLIGTGEQPPSGIRAVDGWWIAQSTFDAWAATLADAVDDIHRRDPLAAGMSRGAARDRLGLPDAAVLDVLARHVGLETTDGQLARPGHRTDVTPIEASLTELETRWRAEPFAAPEAADLAALRLGDRELAAAARAGRVIRLRDGIVLAPTAPALAMRTLATLDQPFTTSAARQALGITRRTAIPLLEHLDARGWTKRLDAGHREIRR
ncbi:selenocysteine-specific translation elongation factor [Gordonia sp. TBRC 11910]|uniref:Selenocysteine-specific elongation factor n=1 Tax=Gordonia asplenii TaxID=2725283 RepID=A0A848L0C7_9ACTN|nr:selenocysteine-specific translation elongation factor [Gordonia asplenii]NMO02093.1 selenocysteine-specific translation elongation factor [Gordonia asplenii]